MMSSWHVVWTIAVKDIIDAIKNRVVLSQIIAVSVILLAIKGLGLVIQPPYTQIVVYDPGSTFLAQELAEDPGFSVHSASSLDELQRKLR